MPPERSADQRCDPEQPKLRERPTAHEQGGTGAAGRLVIGMPTRWTSVSPGPMAIGAKPTGAFSCVDPMMMHRNIIVRTTSAKKPETSHLTIWWACGPFRRWRQFGLPLLAAR